MALQELPETINDRANHYFLRYDNIDPSKVIPYSNARPLDDQKMKERARDIEDVGWSRVSF